MVCLTSAVIYAHAQTQISTANPPPAVKGIVEKVHTELGLNPTQTTKFSNDYVKFLNENAKPGANTKQLLINAGTSFRSYLNDGQFTRLTQMIQAGQLDPARAGVTVSSTTPVTVPSAPMQGTSPSGPKASLPSAVIAKSDAAGLFQQLSPYMNVTADQSAKALPILNDYDAKATAIKTANAASPGIRDQQMNTLNSQTVQKLKTALTDQQITRLALALTMQENILTGKNLTQAQKDFLSKIQNQYKLNDVQLMAVVLVMVEGKLRGDQIVQESKTNPNGAAQDYGKLLSDLDGQLKSALTADQYAQVKADIDKMIKEHKL